MFNLKIEPNIIGISETRLQNGEEPIANISLLQTMFVYSGKGGVLVSILTKQEI